MNPSNRYDVVVVGGGVTGVAAAVTAARLGAKTLLVERNAFLGGLQTSAMVSHFSAFLDNQGKQMVFGIVDEIVQRLVQAGGSVGLIRSGKGMVHHEPEVLKAVLENLCLEAGVELLYFAELHRTLVHDGTITGIEVRTRGGIESIHAHTTIDATGDGLVAISANAEFMRAEPAKVMSAGLMFTVGNVDVPQLAQYIQTHPEEFSGEPRLWSWVETFPGPTRPRLWAGGCGLSKTIERAKAAGDLPQNDTPNFVAFYAGATRPGTVDFNAFFLSNVDWTDSHNLTATMIECRKRATLFLAFLRKYVPGFQDAHLFTTAPALGIRDSRRIVGDYVLTGEDILRGAIFPDAIVRVFFPLDVMRVNGDQYQGGNQPYTIPYRSLLPKGLENLLVPGRSMSQTQDAAGSVRLSTISMLTGQAAGTAAAFAARTGSTARQVDVQTVQQSLAQQNALHLAMAKEGGG